MSQKRVLVRELRALCSAATVFALIFGLVFSNVAQASSRHAPSLSLSKSSAYALCVEHLTHQASPQREVLPATGDKQPGRRKCPNCCLAATLGAALLPERVTNVTTPGADRPVVVAYSSSAPPNQKNFLSGAANGARAPPV